MAVEDGDTGLIGWLTESPLKALGLVVAGNKTPNPHCTVFSIVGVNRPL